VRTLTLTSTSGSPKGISSGDFFRTSSAGARRLSASLATGRFKRACSSSEARSSSRRSPLNVVASRSCAGRLAGLMVVAQPCLRRPRADRILQRNRDEVLALSRNLIIKAQWSSRKNPDGSRVRHPREPKLGTPAIPNSTRSVCRSLRIARPREASHRSPMCEFAETPNTACAELSAGNGRSSFAPFTQ